MHPLKIRSDPKYDNNPLINKEAIDEALKKYGHKLDISDIDKTAQIDINMEGHFLAQNIPEIPSIIIDKICTKEVLNNILGKHDDITHIALSTYASGMDKTIEIIKEIQSEFNDRELYIGGIGTVYPHLQELVKTKNICFGTGVNWLREKFNLKLITNNEFKIPEIYANLGGFPVPLKTAYLVTQLGCTQNCDFCITNNLIKYNPFSNHDKIIKFIEDISSKSNKDISLFFCEPNAFYPEFVWKRVFKHFIENPKKIENNIFMIFFGSLNHINKFDLETIQKKSPLKFLIISYGIESTLRGGYFKNKGNPRKIIERINNLGIFTIHTYIIGLLFQTKKTIDLEIKSNLKFNSDLIVVNSFKPVPRTTLYNQLKVENRLHDRNLPPEFLYMQGFLPFNHEYLGGGFDILKYLYKAYYESEKKIIDVYDNFANKLFEMFSITNSRKIKRAAKVLMGLSKVNFNSFQKRMPNDLIVIYQNRLENTERKFMNL